MSSYTALFDASVLYPAIIRDILLQLAVTKQTFRVRKFPFPELTRKVAPSVVARIT